MKKFAVILCGCGVYDGSEIHEAVMTLYAISSNKCEYTCFSPEMTFNTVNHLNGENDGSIRSAMEESARIARGEVLPLSMFKPNDFDALVIPGGFGAAKNLCDYGVKGTDCEVRNDVKEVILSMYKANKPIGAMCIAPVLISKIFPKAQITIGKDKKTSSDIETLGAIHIDTNKGEVCIDRENKLFTTACYMQDANIAEIGISTKNLIEAILENM